MGEPCSLDVSNEHISHFQAQGFLRLGRITTDAEITWLQDVYDQLIQQKIGYTPSALTRATTGRGPISVISLISPEDVVPALKETLFLRNARSIVARLLGVEEPQLLNGWRIFLKPGHGRETPWHQDAAYHSAFYTGASVWMPLDPATVNSGCLRYIKGSHLGEVLPHHTYGGSLGADTIDTAQAVACPIRVGEANVHHCRTLHGAGPNTTDSPRRALVVVCRVGETIKAQHTTESL